MPKRSSPWFITAYQRHKPSGQARVRLNGRDHYLGPCASRTSRKPGVVVTQPEDELLERASALLD